MYKHSYSNEDAIISVPFTVHYTKKTNPHGDMVHFSGHVCLATNILTSVPKVRVEISSNRVQYVREARREAE